MRYLSQYLQFHTRRLCIGDHSHLLELLSALASALEGDGDVTVTAGGDALLRVVGHCTSAGSAATGDDKVGVTRVFEVETITDVLASRETPKVVQVVVEYDNRHLLTVVISLCAAGISNQVDIGVGRGLLTCGKKQNWKSYKE